MNENTKEKKRKEMKRNERKQNATLFLYFSLLVGIPTIISKRSLKRSYQNDHRIKNEKRVESCEPNGEII